jgi:hypothetical protein
MQLLCFLAQTEHRTHFVLLPMCTMATDVKAMYQIAIELLYAIRILVATRPVHIVTNTYGSRSC